MRKVNILIASAATIVSVSAIAQATSPQAVGGTARRQGSQSNPSTDEQKFSFDIWGDTVNVAARLAAYGMSTSINISAVACEMVKARIEAVPLGPIPIKGKGDLEAYRVVLSP